MECLLDDGEGERGLDSRYKAPHWKVWRAVESLRSISKSSSTTDTTISFQQYREISTSVANILFALAQKYAGDPEWKSLLNKHSLLEEAEESIVALHFLHEWMKHVDAEGKKPKISSIAVVDICCGKGLFSTLLSFWVKDVWKGSIHVEKIILLDKATHVDWNHIKAINEHDNQKGSLRTPLELWSGVDLHQHDEVMDRLHGEVVSSGTKLALVGIHLCKTLGPAFLGIANALGTSVCPFFCLAPCCLPRMALYGRRKRDVQHSAANNTQYHNTTLEICQYETISAREHRLQHNLKRRKSQARKRRREDKCYLCLVENDHRSIDCPMWQDKSEEERKELRRIVQANTPCWNCGRVGHFRAQCPQVPDASLSSKIPVPSSKVDLTPVLKSKQPFASYCQLLRDSVERHSSVKLIESGLTREVNNRFHDMARIQSEGDDDDHINWNAKRKSLFIVGQG